jgi:predicted AAA+ superfamily ATPase
VNYILLIKEISGIIIMGINRMLKRKLYDDLIKWKNESKGSSALLIEGARRIGKSYIAEHFAKNEYKSYILINFTMTNSELLDIFLENKMNLDDFFEKISIYFQTKLYIRDTLFIFDEVQCFPTAREMIKFFVADGRYDYLETGSLLSIKKNITNIVIPSEEDTIKMYPLDFEEFLWAMSDEQTFPYIKKCFIEKKSLGQAIHRKTMYQFRKYMLIGGMPQPVVKYLETNSFEEVDKEKRKILKIYRDDIQKYADSEIEKVTAIFDEIPSQLSKTDKKFILSKISSESRYKYYEKAFIWLKESMISNLCYNSFEPSAGLSLNRDSFMFKCYMGDTGLLISHSFTEKQFMSENINKAILLDNLHLNEGMFLENIVSQMLVANGNNLFFHTYKTNDSTKKYEIDFIIRGQKKLCPIEVKSSEYGRHISLDRYISNYSLYIEKSYVVYTKDLKIENNITYLPIYMVPLL